MNPKEYKIWIQGYNEGINFAGYFLKSLDNIPLLKDKDLKGIIKALWKEWTIRGKDNLNKQEVKK